MLEVVFVFLMVLYPPSDGDLFEFIRYTNSRESSETHLGLSLQKDSDSSQVKDKVILLLLR